MTDRIKCRAKKSMDCCDGMPVIEVYSNEALEHDGTYDDTDNTIVCDRCYMALGMPGISVNASPDEIDKFRRNIGR